MVLTNCKEIKEDRGILPLRAYRDYPAEVRNTRKSEVSLFRMFSLSQVLFSSGKIGLQPASLLMFNTNL